MFFLSCDNHESLYKRHKVAETEACRGGLNAALFVHQTSIDAPAGFKILYTDGCIVLASYIVLQLYITSSTLEFQSEYGLGPIAFSLAVPARAKLPLWHRYIGDSCVVKNVFSYDCLPVAYTLVDWCCTQL